MTNIFILFNYFMIRPDLIFSYWIYAWYILYIFKVVPFNPKVAILGGIVENMGILSLMLFYNTKKILVVLFLIMFFILKLFPLYTIWNAKIKWRDDIKHTLVLLFIYFIWIQVNRITLADAMANTKNLILHNKNTMPGITLLERLWYGVKGRERT